MLDANENYWDGAPAMKRVIIRHVAETATQQLLLEKGDVDIARNLGPDQLETLRKNPDLDLQTARKGGLSSPGLTQNHAAHPHTKNSEESTVGQEWSPNVHIRAWAS